MWSSGRDLGRAGDRAAREDRARASSARPTPSRRRPSTVVTMCVTPASSRSAIRSGQRTDPGSQTRERSLRSRSTIITCSAASFSDSRSSPWTPAGRVPLIGFVQTRSPRRARKSSGEPETIAQPSPASGVGWSGRSGARRGGEPGRIALERRAQVLDEVDLVDVAARDRVLDGLDRGRVALVVPGALATRRSGRAGSGEARPPGWIRAARSGSRHGSGGSGQGARRSARGEPVAEEDVGDQVLAREEARVVEVGLELGERVVSAPDFEHGGNASAAVRGPVGAARPRA